MTSIRRKPKGILAIFFRQKPPLGAVRSALVMGAGVSALLLALMILVPAGRVPAQGGLIGYWAFDGAGADLSGRGRNLDLTGGIGIAAGLFSQALDLHNNGSQFATRPVDDAIYDFGESDFTIQVWVNFNNTAGEQVLLEKFFSQSGPGWSLTKLDGNLLHFFAEPTIALTSAPLDIPSGVWHQILVRRNGTQYQIIYDGSVVAEGSNPGAVPDTDMPLLIGKRNDLDGRGFAVDGRLDEVAIWSRALSDDDIAFLFNGGSGILATSLGAVRVVIDIKPGKFPNAAPDTDTINLSAQGALPVAIFSTGDFDASTVNASTVVFAGAPPWRSALQDVDGDGDVDLLLHFATQALILNCGNTQVVLIGGTMPGTWIMGTDSIRVLKDKNGQRCP
ncbi:MAG: LamG domain-containing protein [bacterium]